MLSCLCRSLGLCLGVSRLLTIHGWARAVESARQYGLQGMQWMKIIVQEYVAKFLAVHNPFLKKYMFVSAVATQGLAEPTSCKTWVRNGLKGMVLESVPTMHPLPVQQGCVTLILSMLSRQGVHSGDTLAPYLGNKACSLREAIRLREKRVGFQYRI
ncbi:hypothetical protein F5877DRAFT_72311 [Lentinula edodes]|nr:hypothetical protein F5877DRAFT_72311 [Lentinula edodes]